MNISMNDFYCEHNCRNTCNSLTRALQLESEIVRLSQETIQQCDDDEIKDADWKLTHMIFTLVVDPGTLCR